MFSFFETRRTVVRYLSSVGGEGGGLGFLVWMRFTIQIRSCWRVVCAIQPFLECSEPRVFSTGSCVEIMCVFVCLCASGRIVGGRWKDLREEEKKIYTEKARVDRDRFVCISAAK